MSASLRHGEARVARAARAVGAADLEHVRVGPASGVGEVLLGERDGGRQVVLDRRVRRADVAGRAVELHVMAVVSESAEARKVERVSRVRSTGSPPPAAWSCQA